jgi:hypothetical protein
MGISLQGRDFLMLQFAAIYGVVTRKQISDGICELDRSIRRRLASLANAGYLKRHSTPSCNGGNSIPVYASSQKGLQAIAQETGHDFYLHFPTGFPVRQNINHSVEIAQTHILFDQAIRNQESRLVELPFWFHENQKINPFAEPNKTTVISSATSSVLCRPDAAFILKANGVLGSFFLEEDRSTSYPKKVFKKKLPGFQYVFESNKHQEHYQAIAPKLVSTFRVLFVCPTGKRRDALKREAERQLADKDSKFIDCFRFIAKYDKDNILTAENLLFEPIAYRCGDDSPVPIVNTTVQTRQNGTTNPINEVTSPLGHDGQASGHPTGVEQ